METESASQRKWRLVREHQEAKAAGRAKLLKPARKPRRKREAGIALYSQQWCETYADNLGESPDY